MAYVGKVVSVFIVAAFHARYSWTEKYEDTRVILVNIKELTHALLIINYLFWKDVNHKEQHGQVDRYKEFYWI